MPTYTYVCEECRKTEEVFYWINEQSKMICCDKKMKKKFGVPLLEFKGHGFHETDYNRPTKIQKDAKKHIDREDPSL